MKKGDRVELHPATDDWMRGDRYGTVVGFGRAKKFYDKIAGQEVLYKPVKVKLDKSGRVKSFHPANVIDLGEQEKAEARAARSTNPTIFAGEPMLKQNPAVEITELVLYALNIGPDSTGNERAAWNQRQAILANLKRKVKQDVYNPALAAKLWGYWADTAAKSYNQIHGTGKYALTGSPFSAADRREAGKLFEQSFRDEVHNVMKNNPRKTRRARKAPAQSKRATQYIIAVRRTTGAIEFYTGAGFGPRQQAAHFMTTDTARRIAGALHHRAVIAPYSTPTKEIRTALLQGK